MSNPSVANMVFRSADSFKQSYAYNRIDESNPYFDANRIKYEDKIMSDRNMAMIHTISSTGNVPVLVDDPGIGKTATANEYVTLLDKEYSRRYEESVSAYERGEITEDQLFPFKGARLILLDLSLLESSDMSGMPAPSHEDIINSKGEVMSVPVVKYLAMPWMKEAFDYAHEGYAVVFLTDEVSNINYEVMASALGFLQDRIILHKARNKDFYRILGCMNPEKTSVNPSRLRPAMNNRIIKIPFVFDRASWMANMPLNWGKPITDNEYMWRKAIVDFLEQRPGMIHKLPADVTGRRENAPTPSAYGVNLEDFSRREILETQWPSPRSWTNLAIALRDIDFARSQDEPDEFVDSFIRTIAEGTVGFEAAHDFARDLRNRRQVNVSNIVRNYRNGRSEDFTKAIYNDTNIMMSVANELNGMFTNKDIDLKLLVTIFSDIMDAGKNGIIAPYSENVLHNAFSEGWGFQSDGWEKEMFNKFREHFTVA